MALIATAVAEARTERRDGAKQLAGGSGQGPPSHTGIQQFQFNQSRRRRSGNGDPVLSAAPLGGIVVIAHLIGPYESTLEAVPPKNRNSHGRYSVRGQPRLGALKAQLIDSSGGGHLEPMAYRV